MDDSDSPPSFLERTTSPQHHKQPPWHKGKKEETSVLQTDMQANADVPNQQSVTEEIWEKANEKRDAEGARREKKEVDSDEKRESNTGTKRGFRNSEAIHTDTSATINSHESLNNATTFSLHDIDTITGEKDLQKYAEINQSPLLVQASQSSQNGLLSLQQDAALLDKILPIKDSDTVINKMPHTKSDATNMRLTEEKLKVPNGKPLSGKSTLKTQEENIQNSEAAALSSVEDDNSNKKVPYIKGTGKKANITQKDPDISKENYPKESRKTPDINKDIEKKTNREKPSGLDPQADVAQRESPLGKEPMTEEEEMMLLQEITKTAKKEAVKGKSKKKSKQEKAQRPEMSSQAKASKKTTQSDTEGKAAFVVGQPKDKKAENKISSPKKPSGTVQRKQTNQETQEKLHEVPEEENNSEKESEDSYVASEHLERSISPTESQDLPSDSDTGVTHNTSSQDVEQTAHKPSFNTLAVTNPTNENEYAYSETSEATSSSVSQQKSTRSRDLSEKAERRRLEVERKRREREEQQRLEKEQQERMERMREELEEEQQRRAEEIRLRKQQEEEERKHNEQEKARRMQLEQQALERARAQQEEYRRKLQEIQRRKQQEELERIAMERQRQQEHARLETEERMRLLEMAEEEREEYLRKKREREEQARQEVERQKLIAEAEAKAIMEEAQRQAQLLARQTAALEQQLQFNRGLMKESIGMDQTQGVSRPWVFSYFELLELLGLPLPVEGETT